MTDRRRDDLARIRQALDVAAGILAGFTSGAVEHRAKDGGSPVTEADLAVDAALRESLPRPDEGWLSEETPETSDPVRLDRDRTWIVDPIDGTQGFVDGRPEWCVSVGLVEAGRPVAGGVLIPDAGLTIVGALGLGVMVNDEPAGVRPTSDLAGARILASRTESSRGDWNRFAAGSFETIPMGSIANKLARVAIGEADGTWTARARHEWDVAAGVALVLAGGGTVRVPDGGTPVFNRPRPIVPGLAAGSTELVTAATELLGWERQSGG